jgi:hypothetical protein
MKRPSLAGVGLSRVQSGGLEHKTSTNFSDEPSVEAFWIGTLAVFLWILFFCLVKLK